MTKPPCTKAIIAVAGFGTRWLPLTKAIEKCMLPVGNRPVIDYLVEDCLAAGITDIIFVVAEDFAQLKSYYGRNIPLEEHLQSKGKTEQLASVQKLADKARFHFVVQDRYQPYGTSVPVHLARDLIEPGERFLVACGDNFFYNPDGSSELAAFIQRASQLEPTIAMLAATVPLEETPHYGVLSTREEQGTTLYEHIVEHPATPAEAPSNLINTTFMIFDDGILPFVKQNVEEQTGGERYIIDAMNNYVAAGNDIAVLNTQGEFMDCGSVDAWLRTNNRILGNA